MRIPTFLAIFLIVIALGLGFILYNQNKKFEELQFNNLQPKEITLSNISDNSITISWQTNDLSVGEVLWGEEQSLGQTQKDDRDSKKATSRLTHFVTIKGLKPETLYFFKVKNNRFTYPEKPNKFKTASSSPSSNNLNKPIIGKVLDPTLAPVDEALIQLKIPSLSLISSFVTTGGNFILPLSNLRDNNQKEPFEIDNKTIADLEIQKGSLISIVKLPIPLGDYVLPPLVMGEDLDLSQVATASAKVKQSFDLNQDGKVNSLDLSLVLNSFGTNPQVEAADFNKDGVVDQQDIELIKESLKGASE